MFPFFEMSDITQRRRVAFQTTDILDHSAVKMSELAQDLHNDGKP
jgi:hypothetical protein